MEISQCIFFFFFFASCCNFEYNKTLRTRESHLIDLPAVLASRSLRSSLLWMPSGFVHFSDIIAASEADYLNTLPAPPLAVASVVRESNLEPSLRHLEGVCNSVWQRTARVQASILWLSSTIREPQSYRPSPNNTPSRTLWLSPTSLTEARTLRGVFFRFLRRQWNYLLLQIL